MVRKLEYVLGITESKGFHIEFENGVTVSVQFGEFNYHSCKRGDLGKSNDAEIGVWDKNGIWITKKRRGYAKGDDVVGYQTPKQIIGWCNWAMKYNEQ